MENHFEPGDPSTYRCEASVVIRAPVREIVRWLVVPDLMARWMGVGRIVAETGGEPAVGMRIRLDLSGAATGGTYAGEVVELGPRRVARRYGLSAASSLYSRLVEDTAGYERLVAYDLSEEPWTQLAQPIPEQRGTQVTCTVQTRIPGLAPRSMPLVTRAEEKALRRALERLRNEVEGRRRRLLGRMSGGGVVGLAL